MHCANRVWTCRGSASGWRIGLVCLALACSDEPAGVGPQAAYLIVEPADAALAPGDTLRLTVSAYDAGDAPIELPALAWRSLDTAAARVDTAGLVTAVGPGDVRIEARAESGARGFASLRVRPIRGISPVHGAFGEVVTVAGAEFGASPRVWFGAVEAFVREVADGGRRIEAWVPVGAGTGKVRVAGSAGHAESDDVFFVTGAGDDALEPNGFEAPRSVGFPFNNPSLVTRPLFQPLDPDLYAFELTADGPVGVSLTDRSAVHDLFRATRFELFNVAEQDIVGIVAGFSPVTREPLQPVTIAVPELPAGRYEVLVTPFSFSGSFSAVLAGDRSYGLAVDDSPSFVLEPDSLEPNDYPARAAVVEFPAEVEAVLENPFAADYYRFDLAARTSIRVQTRVPTGTGEPDHRTNLDLFVMSWPAKSVPWTVATGQFPRVYRASLGPGSFEELVVTVDAGTYLAAIIDSGGVPTPYRLSIGTLSSAAQAAAGGTDAAHPSADARAHPALLRAARTPLARRP